MDSKNIVMAIVWVVIIVIALCAIYVAYDNSQKVKKLQKGVCPLPNQSMYPNMFGNQMMSQMMNSHYSDMMKEHEGMMKKDITNPNMTKEEKDELIKHQKTCPFCSMRIMHPMNPMMARHMMMAEMMNRMMNDMMFPEEDVLRKQMNDIFNDPGVIKCTGFMIENELEEFKVSAIFNKNVTKDMLDVSIEDGLLIIKVRQKEEKTETAEDYKSAKASMVLLNRIIKLPKNADIKKYTMMFEEGVLVIRIPKKAKSTKDSVKLEF